MNRPPAITKLQIFRDGFTLVGIVGRIAIMKLSRQLERLAAFGFRNFIPILAALLFFGAMFWAKGRDPFHRVWFNVKAPGCPKAECVAVLPKTAARPLPVIIYSHGAGGSWLISGNELRRMAEMGLAAVDMDYTQTNEVAFEPQFSALLEYVRRQPWADTNRMAWVGFSLGAQRQLAFALNHPELRPNLLVRVSGGWIPKLAGLFPPRSRAARDGGSLSNHRLTQINADASSSLPSFPYVKSMPGGDTRATERPALASSAPPLSPFPPVKSSSGRQVGSLPPVLLIHGEFDEVFPVSDARRLAAALQSNGVPVTLKIIPGQSHGFEPDRLLLFRAIGEYCLTRLKGPDALSHYQSILLWQAKAKPLWLFWIPAFLWIGLRCGLWYRDSKSKTGVPKPEGNVTAKREPAAHKSHELTQIGETADGGPPTSASGQPATCNLQPATSGHGRVRLRWWEIGLRWVAGLLAVVAAADTALHLIPPRLPVSERTLAIARKHLVQPKEMPDFDFLAKKAETLKAESRKQKAEMSSGSQSGAAEFEGVDDSSIWAGKRLKTLLEHVELANYNRELIDWKLDEAHYRDFVLSPQIHPEFDGDLNWRRPLWENFYPRIRKEQTTADAAVIVARFLRERVTIRKAEIGKAENRKYPHPGPLPGGEGEGPANGGRSGGARHEGEDISSIWESQIADARGFEAVCVAALRAAGVPARLDGRHYAEFWTGAEWRPAPRPAVEAAW